MKADPSWNLEECQLADLWDRSIPFSLSVCNRCNLRQLRTGIEAFRYTSQ